VEAWRSLSLRLGDLSDPEGGAGAGAGNDADTDACRSDMPSCFVTIRGRVVVSCCVVVVGRNLEQLSACVSTFFQRSLQQPKKSCFFYKKTFYLSCLMMMGYENVGSKKAYLDKCNINIII
jgi:hypothetical protein